MSLLKEITIVIPTLERRELLLRSLRFWSRYPVGVVVLDGSVSPSLAASELRELKTVQYFHLPVSAGKRLLFASNKITTPYAAMLSDDEFFLPSALDSAAEILADERNVSAVLGATLAFKIHNDQLLWRYEYESARKLKVTGESPRERLFKRQKVPGNSIFYSLTRSEILSNGLRFIGEYEYSCPYIGEYQLEATFCCAGEVKFIPRLMWIRNRMTPMIHNASFRRDVFFQDWLKKRENAEDIERLKESFTVFMRSLNMSSDLRGQDFIELFGRDSPLPSSRYIEIIKGLIPRHFHSRLRKVWQVFLDRTDFPFVDLELATGHLKLHSIEANQAEVELITNSILRAE